MITIKSFEGILLMRILTWDWWKIRRAEVEATDSIERASLRSLTRLSSPQGVVKCRALVYQRSRLIYRLPLDDDRANDDVNVDSLYRHNGLIDFKL